MVPLRSTGPCRERALVLANRLDDLVRLNEWLESLGEELDLAEEFLEDLKVCVYEAVANIIKYAFDDELCHRIQVFCFDTQQTVSLTIIDDGKPFDPLGVVPAPKPDSVAGATIGGHGIRLIKAYADRLHYVWQNGENRLTIEKDRLASS